jgi:hypothetical protein
VNDRKTTPSEPAEGEGRKSYAVRLAKTGHDAIQRIADRDGISWSEAARRLLAYATKRMPEGWHPGKERR